MVCRMTEDERYEIIVRDRFVCQRCGKPVGVYGQLAHRVKSGKGTLKFIENFLQQNYNKVLTKKDIKNKIIDNKKNLVLTCSLACNDSYNIFNRPMERDELLREIIEEVIL